MTVELDRKVMENEEESLRLQDSIDEVAEQLRDRDRRKLYESASEYEAWKNSASKARSKMIRRRRRIEFELKKMRCAAVAERARVLLEARGGASCDDPIDVLYVIWEELQVVLRTGARTPFTTTILDSAARIVEKKYPIR